MTSYRGRYLQDSTRRYCCIPGKMGGLDVAIRVIERSSGSSSSGILACGGSHFRVWARVRVNIPKFHAIFPVAACSVPCTRTKSPLPRNLHRETFHSRPHLSVFLSGMLTDSELRAASCVLCYIIRRRCVCETQNRVQQRRSLQSCNRESIMNHESRLEPCRMQNYTLTNHRSCPKNAAE